MKVQIKVIYLSFYASDEVMGDFMVGISDRDCELALKIMKKGKI